MCRYLFPPSIFTECLDLDSRGATIDLWYENVCINYLTWFQCYKHLQYHITARRCACIFYFEYIHTQTDKHSRQAIWGHPYASWRDIWQFSNPPSPKSADILDRPPAVSWYMDDPLGIAGPPWSLPVKVGDYWWNYGMWPNSLNQP